MHMCFGDVYFLFLLQNTAFFFLMWFYLDAELCVREERPRNAHIKLVRRPGIGPKRIGVGRSHEQRTLGRLSLRGPTIVAS